MLCQPGCLWKVVTGRNTKKWPCAGRRDILAVPSGGGGVTLAGCRELDERCRCSEQSAWRKGHYESM